MAGIVDAMEQIGHGYVTQDVGNALTRNAEPVNAG
jgi:hypothetical protein